MSAAWRMTVLLPAMLGPVMTSSAAAPVVAVAPRRHPTSLGTKAAGPSGRSASTTGCRPSTISSTSEASTTGRA